MKTLKILAWRNIWRNKRRTIITASSIAFALVFALVMRGFQIGSYALMIDNMVQTYTGYIQIQAKGYWNDKTIDNSFEQDAAMMQKIANTPGVTALIPRLESFALASEGQKTKGVAVCGIDPLAENKLTKLSNKITKGSYLNSDDQGVLIAEGLAKYLKLEVNDTFVMIGQGYHGVSAAGKFLITGILKFPTPELNNMMVYLNLNQAREFFSADNRITSLALKIDNREHIPEIIQALKDEINEDNYAVLSWETMLSELLQYIKLDQGSGYVMLGILYFVIAFGILGTLMMMISERIREFGMMVAVGMKRALIAALVITEMIMIAAIGSLSGIILSLPVMIYFLNYPIKLTGEVAAMVESYGMEPYMPVAFQPDYYIGQILIILLILFVVMIWPVSKILRLNLIQSLRR
jgi:ABC-type lipoprotein release transport system permease subunit